METQSISYNNGRYIELTYQLHSLDKKSKPLTVIIDATTGLVANVDKNTLVPDLSSINKFKPSCCPVDLEIDCEGWSTESGACWETEDGNTWAV